jgi:putative peptide zinc metalloprotease protein
VLCHNCRRQLERGASYCGSCGAPLNGAPAPLELVLAGGERVPMVSELIIGRAPGSSVLLDDPSVSRTHARITADAVLEDVGSSHGTWLDGVRVTGPLPLRDGAKIRLGDAELRVERRREAAEAGRTMFVPAGGTALLPSVGGTQFGMRPRVRSGYALKRLDASEGRQRWVLKDMREGTFLRLSDNDAWVFELLDGSRSLVDLVALCEQRFGATGPARLVRLLTDLGERGFLAGVAGGMPMAEAPTSWWRKLIKPREKIFTGLGPKIEAIYRAGGWVFFTRQALIVIAVVAVIGLGAFIYLIAGRYGTPFVVATKVGVGALVFLLGRFAVVAVHELAHGLTMASFGRRVDRAGLKAIAIFPYAFVDTSEAWFEPRRRRIAVSAAGPVSDFTLGAVFALCALLLPEDTTVRDIFFNLAFAAYVGGFFNLNPFIERDGYHMLVDGLNEPGLRRRAKEQLERRIKGQKSEGDSPVLARYSLYGLGWSVLAAAFAIAITFRYKDIFLLYMPDAVVYGVMGTLWVVFFLPVVFVLGKPLWQRLRGVE